ncbi:MAG TPA: hypothetical protein PLM14_09225 [Candidatus Hydrogenedentes bacterium]|nr:hypothetical protein [Candidatus Hydrogenedentota bacterium]HQH52190.1 hypothetical protein [Candidatus Hydrogenedentota bacterium]
MWNVSRGSIALLVAVASGVSFSATAQEPRGLVINEDNSHFFGSRTADDMTIEGLHAFVDQYAGTKVSHLFLNPNAMRASYRSAVRDAIWDQGSQNAPEPGFGGPWAANAKLLDERGLDPYAVWIARSREKGISPWLSMRMNDVHDVSDPKNFMHSTFWVQHPEYWRVPGGSGWTDRALNYGVPAVREHNMAFIRELLERYDPDGLELDWMRFGYHFAPGEEAEGCKILTQFMRDVRTLTGEWSKKRGHAIQLGARVPAHPDAAAGLGMDGITWAKEGLVDMLVPTPFWTSSDFDIPVELWRERMGDAAARVIIAPGLEFNVRGYPGGGAVANTLESCRGFAAASWHRGANQIYLFNFMDSGTIPVSTSDYRILLEQGLGPDVCARLPRRHIQAFHDTVPAGVSNGARLPVNGHAGGTFNLYTGPAPKTGTTTFIAGLAQKDGTGTAVFDATVNGQPCAPIEDRPDPGQYPGVVRAVQFTCPLDALKDGYTEIHIQQRPEQPEQELIWAEIRIEP